MQYLMFNLFIYYTSSAFCVYVLLVGKCRPLAMLSKHSATELYLSYDFITIITKHKLLNYLDKTFHTE